MNMFACGDWELALAVYIISAALYQAVGAPKAVAEAVVGPGRLPIGTKRLRKLRTPAI